MNIWLLPDPHLGHDKAIELMGRPHGFEDKIIRHLSNIVCHDDILLCLGDVSFYNHLYWHHQILMSIEAKAWLVRGNHDKKSISWYLEAGWDFAGDSLSFTMFGKKLLFTHRPVINADITDDTFDLNIHGHCHNTLHHPVGGDKHRLVYLEHHYQPISLRAVVEGTYAPPL
jgi:calcineurin-like phosphoesterase family protein